MGLRLSSLTLALLPPLCVCEQPGQQQGASRAPRRAGGGKLEAPQASLKKQPERSAFVKN